LAKRPTVATADSARHVRRTAAEHERHIDSLGHCQVRAGTSSACTEMHLRTRRNQDSLRMRDRGAVHGEDKLRTPDRDEAIAFELEIRTDERDLQRGGLSRFGDQRVREPVRKRIHWPCDGDTLRLKAPTAEVLNGGVQARPDHMDEARTHDWRLTATNR